MRVATLQSCREERWKGDIIMNSEKWSKGSTVRVAAALLKTSTRVVGKGDFYHLQYSHLTRGSGLNFASAPLAFQMLSQWFEQLSSKPNSKGSHNNQACNFPSSVQRVSIWQLVNFIGEQTKKGKKRHTVVNKTLDYECSARG